LEERLGLITPEMRKDLDIIRDVRNKIAYPEDTRGKLRQ
jgi:hypothetical protein